MCALPIGSNNDKGMVAAADLLAEIRGACISFRVWKPLFSSASTGCQRVNDPKHTSSWFPSCDSLLAAPAVGLRAENNKLESLANSPIRGSDVHRGSQ